MSSAVSKPQVEAIADVLARIHLELEEIATRIDRNQAAIARSTQGQGISDADYVRAMQDADLSAQRIAGIASFLRQLGEEIEPHWQVDTSLATGTLTLSGLARNIGSPLPRHQSKEEAAIAGEVELF